MVAAHSRSSGMALAAAIQHLVDALAPGEWFSFQRNQRSVKFESQAEQLPVLLRSMVESEADRRGFAERVLPPSDDTDVHRSLADGVLWIHPGESIRISVDDRGIEMAIANVLADVRADYRIHRNLAASLPMSILVHHALLRMRRTLDGGES